MSLTATLKSIYACNPATTRGQATHLGGDLKNGKNLLYCCGNAVLIRELDNPLNCDVYLEHPAQTTVARYSPSGYYIASADVQGNVRIWDTINKEHVLKIELRPLSGPIADLAWSDDSKRIAVCGEGKDSFGAVFIFDSGATVGEISGHSKNINSIDFKLTRPYRIVTGSEDNLANFYAGPPFKFEKSLKDHSRFINCVRFSPDGNKIATVSSDMKGVIYDGKSADKLIELSATEGHKGAIYTCSWSPDSKQLLTGSADKTAKLWDATTGQCLKTFEFPNDIDHMQVGSLWQKDHMITLSLNGELTYLDINNPKTPLKVVRGHQKYITALAVDRETRTLFSGSYDGSVLPWNIDTGMVTPLAGQKHSNGILHIDINHGKMITSAMDDSIAVTDIKESKWGAPMKFESTPMCTATLWKGSDCVLVATRNSVVMVQGGSRVKEIPVKFEPAAIAVNPNDSEFAVGGSDNIVHIYDMEGRETNTLTRHRGAISCLQYSPDGKYLASACRNRDIFVWDAKTKDPVVGEGWCFHTARVNCISWSPDSTHLASGGLDGNAFIWTPAAPKDRIQIKNASVAGVNGVAWIDDKTVAAAGQDCLIRSYTLTF